MQQIFGIFVVLACVLGGFMFMGGDFSMLWQPTELVIIVGAAVGAMVVGNPATCWWNWAARSGR